MSSSGCQFFNGSTLARKSSEIVHKCCCSVDFLQEIPFKVAKHSFQVPMPNSPLLLNHLCFGARFLQELRLTSEVFILSFLQGCVLLPGNGAG